VTEALNSARIIDLDAYRSMRRRQQPATSAGQWQNATFGPSFGAMQLFWLWPAWVWVPMAVPATSAAHWDAL
jgi:hypothetical protein